MASLVLSGDTSGTVTLAAPTVAGTQSYTLPTAAPVANGYALTSTTGGVMSWAAASASPAGSTTQFQYNNAGAFAGASNLTYAANGPVVTSLGVGSTTPSASGAGIAFPATQSPSTDVNTLDDYEEGTWTPSLGGTTTYTTQRGNYVKVGKMVWVECFIAVNSIGTGSTNAISGMPFSPATQIAATCSYFTGLGQSVVFVTPRFGGVGIEVFALTAAGTNCSTGAVIFANSTNIYIAGTFIV